MPPLKTFARKGFLYMRKVGVNLVDTVHCNTRCISNNSNWELSDLMISVWLANGSCFGKINPRIQNGYHG